MIKLGNEKYWAEISPELKQWRVEFWRHGEVFNPRAKEVTVKNCRVDTRYGTLSLCLKLTLDYFIKSEISDEIITDVVKLKDIIYKAYTKVKEINHESS